MRLLVIMVCLFSYVSLNADEKKLSDMLQQLGEKKKFTKSESSPETNSSKKKRKFIFKESYDVNGIGLEGKEAQTNRSKSKSYDYENSSNFQFKFSPGSGQSNMSSGAGGSAGMSGGSGGSGGGHGGGGKH